MYNAGAVFDPAYLAAYVEPPMFAEIEHAHHEAAEARLFIIRGIGQ